MFEKNNQVDKTSTNQLNLDRFKYEIEDVITDFPIIYDGNLSKGKKEHPKIKVKGKKNNLEL